MNARLRSLSALSILAVLGGSVGVSPAQAGFWDEVGEIFGGGRQAPNSYGRTYERSYERSRPFFIKVHPRRQRARPPVMVRRDSPKPEMPKQEAVKAAALDPAKDPKWFLRDPTLRRGDMVVVKGGVLVFEAGGSAKSHALEDFVSLRDSSVPKSTRSIVEKLATAPSRAQIATADAQP